MSEKMMKIIDNFVNNDNFRLESKHMIMYVGQQNENGKEYARIPVAFSDSLAILLTGCKILEGDCNKGFKLTNEIGRELYNLLRKEPEFL
jgi:hypothetical protein